MKRSGDWIPRVINTDKNPAYGEAIAELKQEGLLPKETQHRQVKYLNNRLECDHGKLKRLIKPTLGFPSMKTAYATIKGFEVMRMFKKGQFAPWIDAICGETEARFINCVFRGFRRAISLESGRRFRCKAAPSCEGFSVPASTHRC